MSKIPNKFENPIDIGLANLANKIKPFFYSLNFTPNHITTISVIFAICCIYSLYKEQYILSSIMLLLSYFFDILDGIYARTYDMVTEFGDFYDHISDFLLYLILIPMIIYKCKNRIKLIPFIIILMIAFFVMLTQLGCQEKLYNVDEETKTLSFFKKLCPYPEKIIKFSRFGGCGTFIAMTMILIIISGRIK